MKNLKWRKVGIVLVVIVFAGMISGMAFAATNDTSKPDLNAMYQSFISKFADNLGVTDAKAKQALQDTQIQMVQDAVKAGTITQAQADKRIERIKSGECFSLMGIGRGPGGGHERGLGQGNGSGKQGANNGVGQGLRLRDGSCENCYNTTN